MTAEPPQQPEQSTSEPDAGSGHSMPSDTREPGQKLSVAEQNALAGHEPGVCRGCLQVATERDEFEVRLASVEAERDQARREATIIERQREDERAGHANAYTTALNAERQALDRLKGLLREAISEQGLSASGVQQAIVALGEREDQ
jgi:hypothetical protein